MKISGPKITIKKSCIDCRHNKSVSYAWQGDSGFKVYCDHCSFEKKKYIGDTTWDTPIWCPYL